MITRKELTEYRLHELEHELDEQHERDEAELSAVNSGIRRRVPNARTTKLPNAGHGINS